MKDLTCNSNLIEKANREISQQNGRINEKIDDIMQHVMSDDNIQDRSDWDQIQRTLELIISAMESGELDSEPTPTPLKRHNELRVVDFAEES